MTVYVDDAYIWAGVKGIETSWCHLTAEDQDELDAFARKIDLKKSWKHKDHYDVVPNKRQEAVKTGAVEVSAYELVRLMREWKAKRG